jgi:hypothetical protein
LKKFYAYCLSLLLTFTTAYAVHGAGASFVSAGGAYTGKNPTTEKFPGSGGELPIARALVPELWGPLKAAEADRSQTVAIPTASGVYYAPKFRSFESLGAGGYTAAKPDLLDPDAYEALYVSDSLQEERNHAFSIFEQVEEMQRFVDVLDQHTLLDLPVGIKKEIGGLQYTILIDSMVMTPTHAYLVAYMAFTTPQGKKLAFKGRNIRFSRAGGLQGDARLELLGNHAMNKDAKTQIIFKGNGGTFVEWDCNGFKSMGLEGEIEFSRDLLLPDTESGQVGEDRVRGYFATEVSDWNNLLARVEIDPFQVKRLNGVGFTVKRAVFDFSSLRHVNGMRFPVGYENPLLAPGDSALWEGFYLQELSVRLPQQFEEEGGRARTEFAAYDIVLDNMGFSGLLVGKNLITRDKGRMDTWAMSLDSLYINVVANQLQTGGFTGDVVVPVAEKTPFAYSAIINSGNEYIFNVSPADSLDFDLWKAGEVDIYSASYMEVSVEEGKFYPVMNLHGKMSIAPSVSEGGPKATLTDIEFQDLRIATRGRRISVGALSLGSGSSNQLAKFPFTVKDIGVINEENRLGLRVHMALNLMKASEEGFAADGSFIAWGKVDDSGPREHYRFDGLEVQELGIDVVKEGAYKFKGRVQFFKGDATYGNGFRGMVDAEFAKVGAKAVAIFGNTGQYRYWYADAMLVSNLGIPTGTGLSIYGFGGGAYHHMRQRASGEGAGSSFGQASSGIIYVPDEAYHLGLKASVQLGLDGKKEAFNGDATFEISMNRHGGINAIGFLGNMYFMTGEFTASADKITGGAKQLAAGQEQPVMEGGERAQVKGRIDLRYDFPNKVFHGDLNVFVDAAGGVLKGTGANNQAGWAVLHFAPDTWYVHIGTPDNPIGLEMMRVIRTSSYFMMGNQLPGSPPPPDNVSSILGGKDLDYMRDLNALGAGKGLAFGAQFEASTGKQRFLMFYGHFSAGAGLDIMVKDYGAGAICEGSSDPLGINGWYANGQAYAFVEGNIGIVVDLAFYKGNYDILEIGAAATMQAKGPSPFWMQGTVGGTYNILNGLVKGNCSFDVTIGEECRIINGNPLGDIKVIAEITPTNGEKEVNVFNAPQVVFNMPVDREFEIKTEAGIKTFMIQLEHFQVLDGQSVIAGEQEWNAEHDVLAFNSYDIFPSEKKLKARVQVRFRELKHGSWQTVKVQGKNVTESLEVEFTTGIAPDYIPLENVAYSYPLIRQYNFYPNEANTGYIKLKKGQPELFGIGKEWKQKGRFRSNEQTKLFDYSYDAGARQVNFTIPDGLTNNAIYTFELVNLPAGAGPAIDSNVDSLVSKVALADAGEGTDMSIRSKEAEGTIDLLQEKEVFGTHFRTSYYNTFKAKFATLKETNRWSYFIRTRVEQMIINIEGEEVYDEYEIKANAYTEPLIQLEAKIGNTLWSKEYLQPVLYSNYPFTAENISINHRNTDLHGVPPVKGLYVGQSTVARVLSDEEIQAKQADVVLNDGSFVFNLPHYVAADHGNLKSQVATYYSNTNNISARLKKILDNNYKLLYYEKYPVTISYQLPGTKKVTSQIDIEFINDEPEF